VDEEGEFRISHIVNNSDDRRNMRSDVFEDVPNYSMVKIYCPKLTFGATGGK
jgi:hypothetical protein